MDDEQKQLESQKPQSEGDNFPNIISVVSPLINEFIQTQVRQMEIEEGKDKRRYEFNKALLDIEKSKIYSYSVLLGISIVLFSFFIGGLFYFNQVDKALSILSYLGTAILSILCGYGWGKARDRRGH